MLWRGASPTTASSSAVLRDFSFAAIAAKAGQTNWQILEDRVYESFPSQALSKRIARRIVARANLPPNVDAGEFASRFQQTASAAPDSYGARNTAHFDLVKDSTSTASGVPFRSRVDLPRRYYTVGDIHGVADLWCIADPGHVTVIISLIEGR